MERDGFCELRVILDFWGGLVRRVWLVEIGW